MSEQDATMIDDSEMPAAPQAEAAQPTQVVDGSFDASALEGVPVMGEAIPVGTYHFRLDGFTEGWNDFSKDEKTGQYKEPDLVQFGKQPYFMLNWSCQQEPHTGRSPGPEFCGWCTQEMLAAAKAGDKAAKKFVNQRMMVANDVLAACSLKAVGKMNFKDFLASNPECKLVLGLQPGKVKNAQGQYMADGSMRNRIQRHVSLTRPS